MEAQNKPWPGYLKEDGKFLAVQLAMVSKEFKNSQSKRSQRVGKIIENLATALIEDDHVYFNMFKEIQKFYPEISADWNKVFIKNGGKTGSGKLVRKGQDESELFKVANKYSGSAFNTFQYFMAFVKNMSTNPSEEMPRDEHERVQILDQVVSTIFNGMMMETKWFDVVEEAINKPVEMAFS